MKFDVTAVIKEIGGIETVGSKGFQKRNLILSEESGQYENLVCVEFSGDKLQDPERYQVGQTVKAGGFVNCNEWNGKYFTSLRGSFIQSAGNEVPQQAQAPQMGQAGYVPPQQIQQPQAPQQIQQNQGVDPSMAPPVQPYQAPQQVQPQPVQQPQQYVDTNGQPVQQNDIPF